MAAIFRESFSARYDNKVVDAGQAAVFRKVSCVRELVMWPYRFVHPYETSNVPQIPDTFFTFL